MCLILNVSRLWIQTGKASKYFYNHLITYVVSRFHPLYHYSRYYSHGALIECAFNAKKLCNFHSNCFFFLYFSSLFLDGLPKGFLEKVLSLVIKKVCDLYLTHSLDTSRHVFVKINPEVVIYDKCDTWYSSFTVISISSIKKSTRNSKKLWDKLAS